jgi:hypothetical protein
MGHIPRRLRRKSRPCSATTCERRRTEQKRGAVGGPRMEIAACGGHRGMAERLLHQMDRRAPVEAMAGVGVPPPLSPPAHRHSPNSMGVLSVAPRSCRGRRQC